MRHPEVSDPGMSACQQDVLRFDVPVHDAVFMGAVQGVRYLAGKLTGHLDGKLDLPSEPVAQAFAVDVRHGIPEHAVGLTGIEQGQNVGMVETSGELDLAEKPLRAQRGSELGMEHLERHGPFVLEITSQINRGHATTPELALERVAVGQGSLEAIQVLGQGDLSD
jgi:hypothetical protein